MSADNSWANLVLEDISWVCGCGNCMSADADDGNVTTLVCRTCGPVATMAIRLEPILTME